MKKNKNEKGIRCDFFGKETEMNENAVGWEEEGVKTGYANEDKTTSNQENKGNVHAL